MPSTPVSLGRLKIIVCAQNEWYTQPIPCLVDGGPDTVITLGGFLFRSVGDPGVPDLEAFVKVKRSEVEDRIQRFLDAHPDVSALTKGRVVMDIEKPFPSGFHRQPPRMRARLARAFATRAEAARRKFPNAKLGFYGTLLPDSRGRDTAEYLARIEALVKAGERGMFEEIDFLVPVIYPRFGPSARDGAAHAASAPPPRSISRSGRSAPVELRRRSCDDRLCDDERQRQQDRAGTTESRGGRVRGTSVAPTSSRGIRFLRLVVAARGASQPPTHPPPGR
jgi:hypothetical protein